MTLKERFLRWLNGGHDFELRQFHPLKTTGSGIPDSHYQHLLFKCAICGTSHTEVVELDPIEPPIFVEVLP